MPYLQFLNGGRDQEFEQLNDGASLVLGSGAEAHIRCSDPKVEGKHCTIYPAQGAFWLQDMGAGSTVFNMSRMASSTQGLKHGDVFIVGGTYVKFWAEKPAGDGGGGGGADPGALEATQQELATLKAELEQLKAGAGAAEQAQAQLQEASQKLEATQQELAAAQQELAAAQQSAEEAAGKVTQLETDLATARSDAEAAAAQAQSEAQAAQAEQAEALEATRAALEALRSEQEASGTDALLAAQGPSDLRDALDALGLPDPLRRRVEAAVASEIDRQVLRRSEGPVVALRGLRLPGSDRDVEAEIRAVRRRGEQVEAARSLGLAGLQGEELERLLELARG